MVSLRFVKPSEPIERPLPPTGNAYIYECKWDGFRTQLHKQDHAVQIYSRNGKWLPRFKPMLEPLSLLPARSAIIDAELIALSAKGLPDFRALIGGQSHTLACMCFDILELNGKDLRPLSLIKRRQALHRLLTKADIPQLAFSEDQGDPLALLMRLDQIGMEGIVSKLKDQPYVSGRNAGWIKTKCHAWRKAHAGRGRLFAKKS